MEKEKRIMELELERDNSSTTATDEGSSKKVDYVLSCQFPLEASKGAYRSLRLGKYVLPESWPVYEWPKDWTDADKLVTALITLKELQEKKTLVEAMEGLKAKFEENPRAVLPSEWRILGPVISGRLKAEEYPLAHDCWEICLRADVTLDAHVTDWLLVSRSVNVFPSEE